jgi:hypothetical protein
LKRSNRSVSVLDGGASFEATQNLAIPRLFLCDVLGKEATQPTVLIVSDEPAIGEYDGVQLDTQFLGVLKHLIFLDDELVEKVIVLRLGLRVCLDHQTRCFDPFGTRRKRFGVLGNQDVAAQFRKARMTSNDARPSTSVTERSTLLSEETTVCGDSFDTIINIGLRDAPGGAEATRSLICWLVVGEA